jgi:hypothetical protein
LNPNPDGAHPFSTLHDFDNARVTAVAGEWLVGTSFRLAPLLSMEVIDFTKYVKLFWDRILFGDLERALILWPSASLRCSRSFKLRNLELLAYAPILSSAALQSAIRYRALALLQATPGTASTLLNAAPSAAQALLQALL